MFLKAGALSLALLLASRALGLLRESAQAAAFGTTGLADVAVLMLTLPDWVAGVLASGALAYVLLPAWAGQTPPQVAGVQRKVAMGLLAGGAALGLLLLLWRESAAGLLAGGLPPALLPAGTQAIAWGGLAVPAALLAGLWSTRLQHERDFVGMYSANLVVNAVLIAAIFCAATRLASGDAMTWLGAGLIVAMCLRLLWLHWRTPDRVGGVALTPATVELPHPPVWLWAVLSAGLPLALPFAARSIASRAGPGALATFNYAWKLVELPLILAIQLVATLAFPAIAKALAAGDSPATSGAVRGAFALAWALGCAAAATLLVGAPAIAQLLFGWGRMEPPALARVAHWGALGAWGLLPQALIAVALVILAARRRMKTVVLAYGIALILLLAVGMRGASDGAGLMVLLNLLLGGVALAAVLALGPQGRSALPWRSMAISLACLLALAGLATQSWLPAPPGLWFGLVAAGLAGTAVMVATWWGSADLRGALAR